MNELMELLEELRHVDEVTLLELLDIDSDDIIDAFLDRIKEKKAKLIRHLYE